MKSDAQPNFNLFKLWKYAKEEGLVTDVEAKEIVGLTTENNKSTASRFKFGRTYFMPSLKIHKLDPCDLKPGCDIPIRLITCLQEGFSKRSDVYIASKWLRELQYDYCTDLVQDSIETLSWLEEMDKVKKSSKKRNFIPFTFDFESLYDSLDPDLVITALREAMDLCRSEWSQKFKDWIIDLVRLSIDGSIAEFRGFLFRQLKGLATGGSLIVEIANITVYFVLKKTVYSDQSLMKNITDIKRYIDDGVGIHSMTKRSFASWRKTVSSRIQEFGLRIKDSDWNVPEDSEPVNFLDINFWFDKNQLQTDLYRKPTDARQFLHYTSCHPNNTFSSIVYGSGIRLRRIINNDERLSIQIDSLKNAFRKCKYPEKLLNSILDPIKVLPRRLQSVKKDEKDKLNVMVVSTHGRDKPLINALRKIEKQTNIDFKYLKKTASSLRNKLVKSKKASLGHPVNKTRPCNKKNCMTCEMVSNQDKVIGPNNKVIKTAGGICSDRCLIYHARCQLCNKDYTGKTTNRLNARVSGHRGTFYECLNYQGDRIDLDDDDHILGLHLYFQHGLRHPKGFNESYKFSILEKVNPNNIDLKEHLWIQRLKCIKPYGLNSHDPFGIPLAF